MLAAVFVSLLLLDAKDQAKAAKDSTAHSQKKRQASIPAPSNGVIQEHSETTYNQRGDDQKNAAADRTQTTEHLTPTDRISLALLALTSAYVFLQFYIWRAMIAANRSNTQTAVDSLQLTRESLALARMDLRPWMTARELGVTGKTVKPIPNQQFSFLILVENAGRSPAFVESSGTAITVFPTIPTAIPPFTPPPAQPILAPGDENFLEATIPALTPAIWNDIANGVQHLVLFIVIRYKDSDGNNHETTSAHGFRRTNAGTYRWMALPTFGTMT